jgi:tRNA A-37 threonylcarbamoyl transferase component Bud32
LTSRHGQGVWPIDIWFVARNIKEYRQLCSAGSHGVAALTLYASQPKRQEITMSGINGDKARFNRRRRQKISRRQRNEKMLKALAEKHLTAPAAPANLKEKVA